MTKYLAATAALVSLIATPVLAAASAAPDAEPVRLSEAQLDEVTAGDSLLDVFAPISITLQDITVSLNVANVPVNLGAAVQVNAIGQAIQNATVTSFQQVAQVSATAP